MADIVTTIDRAAALTVRVVRGPLVLQEIADAAAAYYAGEPTTNIVWDFSEAVVGTVTAAEMRSLSQTIAQYEGRRAGGKTALVYASALGYGMGRVFDQVRNSEDAPVEYRSFRDRASALAWVGEPVGQEQQ